ncbi:MAG: SHOCT domain-containing protein [Paludibacteraceae bacterium]|nr:SHOCT domain-containing protein [Paludibacteraceae bacterium]
MADMMEKLAQLAKLQELKEMGALTQSEFDQMKASIIGIEAPKTTEAPDGAETQKQYKVTVSGKKGDKSYVDLGLPSGRLWATCNLGAESVEKSGDFYAYGETEARESFDDIDDYKWVEYRKYDGEKYLKCIYENFRTVNGNEVLNQDDDAAASNWGAMWRIPSSDDLNELVDGCSWEWIENFNGTGVSGQLGTSKSNGNTIFFPTGYYLSTTIRRGDRDDDDCLYLLEASEDVDPQVYDSELNEGYAVRAIVAMGNECEESEENEDNDNFDEEEDLEDIIEYEEDEQGVSVSGFKDEYTYVDLGLESGTLWATYNVGAKSPEKSGDFFAWGETNPKYRYTREGYRWWVKNQNQIIPDVIKYNKKDKQRDLSQEDDAASVNWGDNWMMPTADQIRELRNSCTWEWVDDFDDSGESGLLGESKKNGKTIFLPFYNSKDGDNEEKFSGYFSSSVYTPFDSAYGLRFDECDDTIQTLLPLCRSFGCMVRAVTFEDPSEERRKRGI